MDRYTTRSLSKWATRIRSWKKQGCDVFVYFDNDQKSAAPADALKLKELLRKGSKGRATMDPVSSRFAR